MSADIVFCIFLFGMFLGAMTVLVIYELDR